MTYQNTADSSALQTAVSALRAGLAAVGAALTSFGNSYAKAAVASSRIQLIEKLQAKSDAELAQLGLKRDEITHHVLRDLYFL